MQDEPGLDAGNDPFDLVSDLVDGGIVSSVVGVERRL